MTTESQILAARDGYIFKAVEAAMQAAEEIGGPEGSEYIALMTAIEREASQRASNCLESNTQLVAAPERCFAPIVRPSGEIFDSHLTVGEYRSAVREMIGQMGIDRSEAEGILDAQLLETYNEKLAAAEVKP